MKADGPISAVWPGQPYPRGATWDGEGVNFSLFSANATKVELCLFDPSGRHEIAAHRAARAHRRQSGMATCPRRVRALLYGYRVHGPYDPERGHRFNPHKLLHRALRQAPAGTAAAGATRISAIASGTPTADLSFDRRDSAPGMPKCRVIDPAFTWGDDRPPRIPWHDTVIYEAHVRGFTHAPSRSAAAAARHLCRTRHRADRSITCCASASPRSS